MRTVLFGDNTKDKRLQAALDSIGYTESGPVLRAGHPIWDSAGRDITDTAPDVAFVPIDTHSPRSILGNMSLPMCKEFHEALCE